MAENWFLLAIAKILEEIKKSVEQGKIPPPTDGYPLPPIKVEIATKPSEVVMDIQTFSIADLTYKTVLTYTVEKGYKVYLDEVSIAPDTTAKTKALFLIIIGSAKLEDKQLLTTISLKWYSMELHEGSTIQIMVKSTDGSTVGGNAAMNGRRERIA